MTDGHGTGRARWSSLLPATPSVDRAVFRSQNSSWNDLKGGTVWDVFAFAGRLQRRRVDAGFAPVVLRGVANRSTWLD